MSVEKAGVGLIWRAESSTLEPMLVGSGDRAPEESKVRIGWGRRQSHLKLAGVGQT